MSERLLVLIGGLAARHRERVREWALRAGAPVYAEPLSGLREDIALEPLVIHNERMLTRGGFERVIRIGNVPTLRFWRDLDEKLTNIQVTSYSYLPFSGLPRGELQPLDLLPCVAAAASAADPSAPTAEGGRRYTGSDAFFAEDRQKSSAVQSILDDEPHSELSLFRKLSTDIPRHARIYLGNSLPIREWDLAATREDRGFTFEANRGANGIDGQLSTFFGWCKPGADNWCIVGDLTALYDLNAPWAVPQLGGADFRIVIINNGGGRIFSRVASLRKLGDDYRERVMENPHAIRFEQWAAMWGISDRVIELRPDAEASRRAWQRYDELWS